MKNTRRLLAAVMFTDMVGFTALMQSNEDKAKQLRDKHREVINDAMKRYDGELIQYYGDGTLSIFSSAVDAARCGIYIQTQLVKKPTVQLRVGIHSGDIVHDHEGIYGDGVNVAARVESLATPTSVLVSEKVFDDLKNHEEFNAVSLGSFQFKNVSRPIEVYALLNEPLIKPRKDELNGKTSQPLPSVAVLPFANWNKDQESEFFSDGITEEILNELTKIEGLRVTSRTSSFAFKNKNIDIREIGRQLDVDTIIEGSIRTSGKKVRITAQMIKVSDGFHLWSETYNRDLHDVFEVQDDVAQNIANRLRVNFDLNPDEHLASTPTNNLEAYSNYLKGKYYWNQWNPDGMRAAMTEFDKAIAEDANFSLPYEAKSTCLIYLAVIGHQNPSETYVEAKRLAKIAIELNPESAGGFSTLGTFYFMAEYDWDLAQHYFNRALQLNANSSEILAFYALFLVYTNRKEEAVAVMDKAVKLNPLSPLMHNFKGMVILFLEKPLEAVRHFERALEIDEDFRSAIESKAMALVLAKRFDEAQRINQELQDKLKDPLKVMNGFGVVYALTGQTEKAIACIRNLDKRQKRDPHVCLDLDYAVIYNALGDYDKTLYYLDKAFEKKMGIPFLDVHPIWKNLRNYEPYRQLLRKHGF
jgi:TolB-like protein/class 3 adenylate cyclase/Flp pilus assembly protein TadD